MYNGNKKEQFWGSLRISLTIVLGISFLVLGYFGVKKISAQTLGFLMVKGNDVRYRLPIILLSEAVAKGKGVVKIKMSDGQIGAADFVETTDLDASPVRVRTPYGTKAWRKVNAWCFMNYGGVNSSIAYTSDGGYVTTGTINNGATNSRYYLETKKYDSNGLMQWNRQHDFSFDNSVYGNSIIQTTDGGYAIAGVFKDEDVGEEKEHGFFVKLDASGQYQGSALFGGAWDIYHPVRAYDIIQTSDGGYILVGVTAATGPGGGVGATTIEILKLNSSYSPVWEYGVGGPSVIDFYSGSSVVGSSDGGFVVAGRYGDYNNGANNGLILVKFDSVGNIGWAKKLGGAGTAGGYFGGAIVRTSDNGYAVVGGTSYGVSDNKPLLVKFDSNGTFQWAKVVDGGTAQDETYSLAQTSDGGLVMAGLARNYGGVPAYLVKFSSTGSFKWARAFGAGQVNDIVATPNGGVATGGITWPSTAGILLKFDSNGLTCGGQFVTPTILTPSPTITTPTLMIYYAGGYTSSYPPSRVFQPTPSQGGCCSW